ncbi:unnamed protein product [Pseudo-nitzschia multistriata]|uniref:Uncharacterized protein n=1 Tax=Pseudo-nitzschia multistriata TaxID=183589 RepID=A0A448YZT6_9STRA|nr:unnamed protein product [Pseudo-nitzschia multistriata]
MSSATKLPSQSSLGRDNETGATSGIVDSNPKTVDSEFEQILRIAGIESAPMDPSSAAYLRTMIRLELEKADHKKAEESEEDDDVSIVRVEADGTESASAATQTAYYKVEQTTTTSVTVRSNKIPPVDSASAPAANTKTIPPKPAHLVAAEKLALKINSSREETNAEVSVKQEEMDASESNVSVVSMLRKELSDQKRAMDRQSEILLLLSGHLRELTDTVHHLKNSVEGLQQQQVVDKHDSSPSSHSTLSEGAKDRSATVDAPVEIDPPLPNQQPQNDNGANGAVRGNAFRRAHELAHHVAWRVVTFPIRALLFCLKYEYRIWLVLWRLAKRDLLNPFREAGMIFQLGFALMIIYGRIAPALEKAWEKKQANNDNDGDDDSYDGDEDYIDMDDPHIQVLGITVAVVVGFVFHVGIIGLFYRFFLRDQLHVRIWKDLRAGVELTPTYGLDMDQIDNTEDGRNNNNNVEEQDAANDNRGLPRPQNRRPPAVGRNPRGNVRNGGFIPNIANAVVNGVNDFFMGHYRRPEQRAAIGGGAAARANTNVNEGPIEEAENDAAGHNPGNPLVNFVLDILCLFYSFFLSILPVWNYEQQLRDIRDEQDRLARARVQREAEALRNQNNNNDVEAEDESQSKSEESDDESDSERG